MHQASPAPAIRVPSTSSIHAGPPSPRTGMADLYLTITCNPNWKEIVAALPSGRKSVDCPRIVVRVFRQTLKALLRDLLKNQVLGRIIKAYTFEIKFQKRGLPYAHILLILEDADKPRIADDIDKLICAELRDKYDCHMNLEICTAAAPPPRNRVPVDEISRFADARYVTSSESVWRALAFPLYEMFPRV